ncbi:MAG TPA: amidohydrolase family protein [Bryobacteraceae bacterium]|nr:amidohydrolase family protein [Bryobacteraceae bacterium]
MRIDSHQHFWDLERFPYPWMPPSPSPIRRNFLPKDLKPILDRNQFDGCVVVQATTVDGEAEWLIGLSKENPFILGVVAWVDLRADKVGERLDALQKYPQFRGVRHPAHDEDDVRWLLRPEVIRGLKELESRNIPYDLLLRPQHLPVIPELAAKLPKLRMVIDHIAKPNIERSAWDPWADDMERCAKIPGLHVKISGMITEADWKSWKPEQLKSYVQHTIKHFGADRCMFGSDWPVCLLAGEWKEVLAAFTQAHGPLPQETRSKIMGETAAKFYSLQAPKGA